MDNQIIGLVGGVSSGKSVYIASLIKQFEKERVRERIGCEQFRPLNQQIDEKYEQDYYKPLFVDKIKLPRTQVNILGYLDPLTYVLDFRKNGKVKRINLIFFDGAGEGIEDQKVVAQNYRYITNASALIFMVDPLALPGFTQRLPTHLWPKSGQFGKEPAQLLGAIIEQIRLEQRSIRGTDQLDIPLAITLSKSDLFKYTIERDEHPVFLQDQPYTNGFEHADQTAVEAEVEEMIKRFDGTAILQSSRAFKDRSYFAVSATGSAVENDRFPIVSPRRCVDPLLWCLWRLGVIEPT